MFLGASQVVLVVKNPPASVGDIRGMGSIPGLGRSPGGGHGKRRQLFFFFSLQYFFLENSHGQRSLAGYSPYGCKELDTTKVTEHTRGFFCCFSSKEVFILFKREAFL